MNQRFYSYTTYLSSPGSTLAQHFCLGGLQTILPGPTTIPVSGCIEQIGLYTNEPEGTTVHLLLFDENPGASTLTDDAAFVLAAADQTKLFHYSKHAITEQVITGGLRYSVQVATNTPVRLPYSAKGGLYWALITDTPITITENSRYFLQLGVVGDTF